MAEEFQESDVIFRHTHDEGEYDCGFSVKLSSRAPRGQKKGRRKKQQENSIPIAIPEIFSGHSWVQSYVDSNFFDDDGDWVPPQLIVDRRMSEGRVAFSMSSGRGRTLKGRELSEVRNSILKLTGFLEN